MRRCPCFPFVVAFALLLPLEAWAQDPPLAPEPTPVPAATPSGYPDIDSLREPGSSAKLFPAQSPGSTVPGTVEQGGTPRTGQQSNALLNGGQHRRAVRANDLIESLADADPLELRVAYRRAKTLAMVRDPGMAALLHQAAAAGTDVQKRAFLKQYYIRLFDGVRKADPSPEMKKHVALLSQVAEQRYDPQRRAVGGEEDIVRGGGRRGRAR